jgi:hypothetical protein
LPWLLLRRLLLLWPIRLVSPVLLLRLRLLRVRRVHPREQERGHGRRRLVLLVVVEALLVLLAEALLVVGEELVEEDEVVVLCGCACALYGWTRLSTSSSLLGKTHPSINAAVYSPGA